MILVELDGVECTEIPWGTALELWSEIEPYIISALEYDLYASTSSDKIKQQISTGFARVLVCVADDEILSATIVQLHKNTRQERVLHVVCTAGDKSEHWLPALVEALRTIASEESCDGVTMAGRPGWTRKLRQYGFKTAQVVMRMNDDGWSKQERVKLAAVR